LRRARPIGINHVALEVADVEEALTFYGRTTCATK
jgi:catechol 2,3-dioxygenase-like lactoylglutathione lyase family enzyme